MLIATLAVILERILLDPVSLIVIAIVGSGTLALVLFDRARIVLYLVLASAVLVAGFGFKVLDVITQTQSWTSCVEDGYYLPPGSCPTEWVQVRAEDGCVIGMVCSEHPELHVGE